MAKKNFGTMRKIIVFDSIHYVIKADKLLQKTEYKWEMITTPREISSNCGMSIEPREDYFMEIFDFLTSEGFNMRIVEVDHG